MKFIQVPAGFSLELFASEPDIVKPISFTFDERGRLWVIEAIDYPNDVRNGEPGDDRIKIVEDTDGDGKADKFTVFADHLNLADQPDVRQRRRRSSPAAPHMLFLKDTDGDGKADVRQILSTGWGIRDTHAGPSNLQYGPDNYIWGSVGYSGFDGEMNGKKLQFTQGTYRFKPDGSDFEYVTMSTNNTWGLGLLRELRRVRLDREQRSQLLRRDSEPLLRGRRRACRRRAAAVPGYQSAAQFYTAHYTTPYIRQVDVFGGYTAGAGHYLYTARSFPKEYWNRIAFISEPTAHIVGQGIIESQGAGFVTRDGWNLLSGAEEWVAPVHAQVGTRRRGLGLRLVQLHRAAQPDADGLRERQAATPTSSRCAITRAAASTASSTSTRRRRRSDRCSRDRSRRAARGARVGQHVLAAARAAAARRARAEGRRAAAGRAGAQQDGRRGRDQRRRVARALDAAGARRDGESGESRATKRRSKR